MNRPMPKFTEKHIARFQSRIAKGAPNECWEWQSYTFGSLGYGCFKAFYEGWGAHRVAYYLCYGEDPGELCVCHLCDNPVCCNPSHLWLGTPADNIRDMREKGRSRGKDEKGEKNPLAKLTDKKVKEIRKLHTTGNYTQTQLAKKYGVSIVAIHYVVKRKTWTHI